MQRPEVREITEEELAEINARQRALEQLVRDELLTEEHERLQEWADSREEGPGVTPGTGVAEYVDAFQAVAESMHGGWVKGWASAVSVTHEEGEAMSLVDERVEAIKNSTAYLDDPQLNPKEAMATRDKKLPLHLLEPTANAQIAQALDHGAFKYGRRNFMKTPILANVYIGAVRRHIDALHDGQDFDPDTALSHWAHIGANVHVALAAIKAGTYVDDTAPEEQSEVQKRMSDASNRTKDGLLP